MTVRHSRHQLRKRPALIALVSLLCLAGHVSALLHLLVVRHEICAEHGEFVHGRSLAVGAMGAIAARPDHGEALNAATAPESGDDHCTVLAVVRAPAVTVAPASTPAPASETSSAIIPSVAQPSPTVALLRIAPKTSPPASLV